jgi:hypothetical protein
MRAGARSAAVVVALALIAPLIGCGRDGPRVTQRALQVQMARTYKIAYDTRRQLALGRRSDRVIDLARAACRPVQAEPAQERDWRWTCVVLAVAPRVEPARRTQYGVTVDRRGCFEAKTGNVASRVPERALDGRLVPNPLHRFFGCGH